MVTTHLLRILLVCGLALSSVEMNISAADPAVATKEDPFVNSLGMRFVRVPADKHNAILLVSIWDVRVIDYKAFLGSSPPRSYDKPSFAQGSTHPIVDVTWTDAKAFCRWLTQREQASGLIPKTAAYRLPTDVEWSYAAGIGAREAKVGTPHSKAEVIKDNAWGRARRPPKNVGNLGVKWRVDKYRFTSPVGSFRPNQFGLYDMVGNVWQWCEDLWDPNDSQYREYRVMRGTSWFDGPDGNRCISARYAGDPDSFGDDTGFRCVLDLAFF